MVTFWTILLGWVIAAVQPAFADAPTLEHQTTIGYERGAQLVGGINAPSTDFEMTPFLLHTSTRIHKLPDGAKLSYGLSLEWRDNASAFGEALFETGAFAQYHRSFGANDTWKLRFKGEFDRSVSSAHWVFQRSRLTGELKHRHSGHHTTAAMIRVGWRDQNDFNFDGYDQSELLTQITHTFRPNKDRLTFIGVVYRETRDAEAERFSYLEKGVRLSARYPVSDVTEVTARAAAFERDYHDVFSQAYNIERHDRRVQATVELKQEISEQVTGKVFVGWERNRSNIAERDYSGGVVGLRLTYTWD